MPEKSIILTCLFQPCLISKTLSLSHILRFCSEDIRKLVQKGLYKRVLPFKIYTFLNISTKN